MTKDMFDRNQKQCYMKITPYIVKHKSESVMVVLKGKYKINYFKLEKEMDIGT